MVTMVDEIYDRHYQAGRNALNATLRAAFGSLGRSIKDAFEILVKIEYQAPWANRSTRARCN